MPLMYIVLIPKPTSYKVLYILYSSHRKYLIPNIFRGRTPLHSYCQWDTRTHDWRRP
jgi:hypothetical protein